MQFQVPKFIEREPKIIGPFTLKQFLFIGTAGAICLFLRYLAPPWMFFLSIPILGGGSFTLAFVRINGRPIPIVIKNFAFFSVLPKIYIWKRKTIAPKFIKKKRTIEKKIDDSAAVKIVEKSHLRSLSIQVEMKKD